MPGQSPVAVVFASIGALLLPLARCLPGESSSGDKETLIPHVVVVVTDARDERAASRVEEVGTTVGVDEAGCDAAGAPDAAADAGSGGGDDSGDLGPFAACDVDDDCVATARLGCCDNGWLVAINRAQVDAYDAAFACRTPRPVCAMYRVIDTRVAECDNATKQCVMIAVDQIACGGFIRNAHPCPDGYACDYQGHVPDVPGQCVATDGGSQP
jgi:hypothetical protein